jgi:Protein of unknown function (DUF4231)
VGPATDLVPDRAPQQSIDRARVVALVLAIAAATLAVAAVQVAGLASGAGRTLAAAAAISAGLGPLSQRRAGTDQIRAWTRARSASEALKTEVYSYLAGGSAYAGDDRVRHLGEATRGIVADVADLQRLSLGITADDKPVPAVTGIDTYISERVNAQINGYYRPKAALYEQRVKRLHAVGDLLAVVAVGLRPARKRRREYRVCLRSSLGSEGTARVRRPSPQCQTPVKLSTVNGAMTTPGSTAGESGHGSVQIPDQGETVPPGCAATQGLARSTVRHARGRTPRPMSLWESEHGIFQSGLSFQRTDPPCEEG